MSGDFGLQSLMMGSMPQSDANAALEVLNQHPISIPTWPQLPARSFLEGMIPQYSEGMPAVVVEEDEKKIWLQTGEDLPDKMVVFYENVFSESLDAFAVTKEFAAGLTAFQSELETRNRTLPAVKGQVTGPFTFGLGVTDDEGRPVWFDEQYRDVIVKGLTMKALWMARELGRYAEKVIIFFDEPIVSALGTPSYVGIQDLEVIAVLDEMVDALHKEQITVGVHCCGNADWGLLARTSIDIIAFDAYSYGDRISLYPEHLSAFLDRGGILGWGIVPTGNSEELSRMHTGGLKEKIDGLVRLYGEKGIPEGSLRQNMILTPSCGMGSLTEEDSITVLSLLAEMTQIMRG